MSFHSRWRASAYLLLIHLFFCLVFNQFFYSLEYRHLFKILLLPIVLFDAAGMGFFAFKKCAPKNKWDYFFGGPSKMLGLLLWAILLFVEFTFLDRADPIWAYLFLSLIVMIRFKGQSVPLFHKDEFFYSELTFLVIFHGALVMMCFFPEIYSGEKAMDASFFGQYLRHEVGPLDDPWFAGKSMGYYSFGYFLWAKLLQIFSLPLNVAYHVALSSTAALLGQVLFALDSFFSRDRLHSMLLSFTTLTLPNLTALYFAFEASPAFHGFWNSTRTYPNNFFAEFTFWSFAFGDLHPHVMNYPLVATFLFLILFLFNERKHSFDSGLICALSLSWGALVMTNFWDAPFAAVTIVPLIFFLFVKDKLALRYLLISGLGALLLMLLARYQMGPSISKVFYFHVYPWGFWQSSFFHCGWMIVLSLTLAFFEKKKRMVLVCLCSGLLALYGLSHFIVLMDEINTIFKTHTYLFFTASILLLIQILRFKRKMITVMLLAVSLFSANFLLKARSKGSMSSAVILKGDDYLKQNSKADYAIITWLNQNVTGNSLILEFPGKSFHFGTPRIGMLTGLSLYLGWDYHVQLRGAKAALIRKREREIEQFYENTDILAAHAWAKEKGLKYIVVSDKEYGAYPGINLQGFDQYKNLFEPIIKEGRARLFLVL